MMDNLALPEILLAGVVGVSLATAVGFRIFAPMLLVGIAAKSGHLNLAEGFEWLGSDVALVMLGIAAVAEISAYFFPFFDHLLDSISGPVAMGAGTLLMASTLIDMEPWLRWSVALVAGGGLAGLTHFVSGLGRATSTATTGGLGNPVYATMELGLATLLTVLAVALPVAALALMIVLGRRLFLFFARRRKSRS
jgi:Domain of unknown function (DUF4126)